MHHTPSPYAAPVGNTLRTNPLAVVSLVFGLLNWLLLPLIGSVVAIITGHMARGQIRRSGEQGAGMALAGLILGYLWWVLLVPILGVVAAIALPAYQDYIHRAQTRQLEVPISQLRQQVADYWRHNGDLSGADFAYEPGRFAGLDMVRVEDGVIHVRYAVSNTIPTPMHGQSLVLVPQKTDTEGDLDWYCESNLADKYLPALCFVDAP